MSIEPDQEESAQYQIRQAENSSANKPDIDVDNRPNSERTKQVPKSPAGVMKIALAWALVINIPLVIGMFSIGSFAELYALIWLGVFTVPVGGVILLVGVVMAITRAYRPVEVATSTQPPEC